MKIDTSAVTSHFTNPQDGFTTTLSGSVSSGATTVGLNSTGDYDSGDIVVFIVDPADTDKKQVLAGIIDVGGSQVTDVKWVGGTNQSHSAGATVVDYYDAAHVRMMTKGLLVEHGQDGKHDATKIVKTTGDQTIAGIKTFNTTPVVPDSSWTPDKLNLPYGRIYYSTTGGGGGQVISGSSTSELNFNTLDPDSVDVTSPGTGQLQVNTAGVYQIAAHASVVDAPQDTNQLIRIQASTNDGSTWFQIVAWSQTNAGFDTTNRSISASTVVKLPANARIRALYANQDTSATRLAALDANDQKYTCSLVVAM